MNKVVELTLCIVFLPLLCLAQVELIVVPTNPVVRVYEPVIFEVAIQNASSTEISGLFILSGAYHGFEIDITKSGNWRPDRFHNAVMREMMVNDVLFQPVVMKRERGSLSTFACCITGDLISSFLMRRGNTLFSSGFCGTPTSV